jgi:hypothetical protein
MLAPMVLFRWLQSLGKDRPCKLAISTNRLGCKWLYLSLNNQVGKTR